MIKLNLNLYMTLVQNILNMRFYFKGSSLNHHLDE